MKTADGAGPGPGISPGISTYLNLLRGALRDRVMPATIDDPVARQTLGIGLGLLARMATETGPAGRLRLEASGEVRMVLRDVAGMLSRRKVRNALVAMQTSEDLAIPDSLLQDIPADLIERGSADALAAAKRLMAIDARVRRQIEANVAAELATSGSTAGAAAPPLDGSQQARLADFLRQQFPADPAVEIAGVRAIPGGFSKQTLFVELHGSKTLPETIVIRRDGQFLPSGNSVSFEYPILERLYEAGVRVPLPLAMDSKGDVLGTPFIAVTRVSGATFGDVLDVRSADRELGLDLARQLARLHAVPAALFPHVAGSALSPRARVQGEIEADHRAWRALNTPCMALAASFAWLLNHLELADGPRCLVHRDVGAHNLIADQHEVSAILDWEIAVIGTPAEDLGYAYYTARQLVDWNDFLAAYSEHSGARPTKAQLDFYALWGATRLAVLIAKARAGVLAGQLEDLGLAYVGEHYVQRLICRVAEILESLLPA